MSQITPRPKINAPSAVRYIKLGVEGAAAAECLANNVIALGFPDVPEDACQAGAWEAVRAHFIAAEKTDQKASDHTREIRDFYTLGEDALWVTFLGNELHWAFAQAEVYRDESAPLLKRRRRVIGQWSSADLHGAPLLTTNLSTRLTRVRGYRSTICKVAAADYLVRRLTGKPIPWLPKRRPPARA